MFQPGRVPYDKEAKSSRIEYNQSVICALQEEKERLGEHFPVLTFLLDEALEGVYSTGKIPGKEFYADVYNEKPLKVTQKVYIPMKEFPFNFTGKLLGPKGNTLRRLQEETQCRIVLKGRNSMRDKAKEEELRESGDPKYAHFKKDLYVEISAIAAPPEAYARVAYALCEIRKYIIPDKNDEVSQEQYQELLKINPELAKAKMAAKPIDRRHMKPNGEFIYNKILGSNFKEPVGGYEEEEAAHESVSEYHHSLPAGHQQGHEYNRAYKRTQPTTSFASNLKRGRDSLSTFANSHE